MEPIKIPICPLSGLLHQPRDVLDKYQSLKEIVVDPLLTKCNFKKKPDIGYEIELALMETVTLGQLKMVEDICQKSKEQFLNQNNENLSTEKKTTKNIKKNGKSLNTKKPKKNNKKFSKKIDIDKRKKDISLLLEKYKEFALMKNTYFEQYIVNNRKKFVIIVKFYL